MSKGEQTRSRMVSVMADLLRQKGFYATGMNEVVEKARAPKGSVYFHFPGGKDELATAALHHVGDAWREQLAALLATRPPDLVADLALICDALARELEGSGFANGCPLATVTLETAASHEGLQALSAAHYRDWERFIAARFEATGLQPDDAALRATLVLSAIEGALLLSRAYHDTGPLHRVAEALARAYAPPSKKGR